MFVSASADLVHLAQVLATSRYPLLAAACEHAHAMAATAATLAESLAPATACTRAGEGMWCAVNGSDRCAARDVSAALHSIFDGGPCRLINRSVIAAALVALEADLEVAATDGTRTMSADEYFALADANTAAPRPADLRVVGAHLPAAAADGLQRLFLPPHSAAGASVISLAAVQRSDGDVRLVLGGVFPRPYRVYNSVEEETMAGGLDEDAIAGLADRALLDAEIDPRSAGRVDVAAALLRDAITAIAPA